MDLCKKFESKIKDQIRTIKELSFDRLYDPVGGYKGISNIADFQGYIYPYSFYLECKTISGNTFNFSNLTETQYEGGLAKTKFKGIYSGVLIWWYEKDITAFFDIREIKKWKDLGNKSINVKDLDKIDHILLKGKKKSVYFEYDMIDFVKRLYLRMASKYKRDCMEVKDV